MTLAITLLAIGQLFCWASLYYSFPALLLKFEDHFGWSRAEITLAMTLGLITTAVLSPVAGHLIDKGKGQILLATSACAGAVALCFVPHARSLSHFYLIWVIIGAAMAGALYEPCFALLVRHLRHRAAHGIGLITLVAGFASTISFPLGNSLAERWGLGAAMAAFAALAMGIGAPCLWMGAGRMRTLAAPAPTSSPSAPAEKLNDGAFDKRTFFLLTASFSLVALVQGAMLNHLLPLLQQRQLSAAQSVALMTLLGPLQVIGRVVWIVCARWIAPVHAMVVCLGAMLASLLLLYIADARFDLLLLFMALLSSSFGIFYILKPVTTRHFLGDRNFGSINGAMAVPYLCCFALAPVFGSLVWLQSGYASLTLLMAGATALALLLFLIASLTGKTTTAA